MPVMDVIEPKTVTYVSVDISFDHATRRAIVTTADGSKDKVVFSTEIKCILHFINPAVFGTEYLQLEADTPTTLPVVAAGQQTSFDVYVLYGGPVVRTKPKPIP